MTIEIHDEKIAALLSLALSLFIGIKISKSASTSSKSCVHKTGEDEETVSLTEDLLDRVDDNDNNNNNSNETTGNGRWSPLKKGAFWCFLFLVNCLNLWLLVGHPLWLLLTQSSLVIPPIHPQHAAYVTYSTETGPDGTLMYRRDITAPCQYGVLTFSVGPAKDGSPYTYELYNEAYAYYDNHGLCIFRPTYGVYATSPVPWKNPEDRSYAVLGDELGNLNIVSSRVIDPFHSNKTWNPSRVGDYVVIGKTDFYEKPFTLGFFQDEIHSWSY